MLLKSFIVDCELGLINSLKRIFPDIKIIGCFFHYTRALRSKANELKLLRGDIKNITNDFLKLLYKAPFIFRKDTNYINAICEKYMQEHKYLENFINYYKNQWQKYFKNGMLDYSQISKSQRSNSYIENYNRRIKLKLSNFLYGKNKCKISWPLFLYFITHEEDEIKKENFNIDNSIEIKVENVNQKDFLKEETVKEKKGWTIT